MINSFQLIVLRGGGIFFAYLLKSNFCAMFWEFRLKTNPNCISLFSFDIEENYCCLKLILWISLYAHINIYRASVLSFLWSDLFFWIIFISLYFPLWCICITSLQIGVNCPSLSLSPFLPLTFLFEGGPHLLLTIMEISTLGTNLSLQWHTNIYTSVGSGLIGREKLR